MDVLWYDLYLSVSRLFRPLIRALYEQVQTLEWTGDVTTTVRVPNRAHATFAGSSDFIKNMWRC